MRSFRSPRCQFKYQFKNAPKTRPPFRSCALGKRARFPSLTCWWSWMSYVPSWGSYLLPCRAVCGVCVPRTSERERKASSQWPPCPWLLTVSQTHVKWQVCVVPRARLWPMLSGWPLSLSFLFCKRGLIIRAWCRERAFRRLATPGITSRKAVHIWTVGNGCFYWAPTMCTVCAKTVRLRYFLSVSPTAPRKPHFTERTVRLRKMKWLVPGDWTKHHNPSSPSWRSIHFK